MHQPVTPRSRRRPRSTTTASTRSLQQCGSPPPHLLGLGAVSGTVRLRESDFSVTKPLSATVHAVLDAASFHTGYQRTRDGWKFAERVYEVRYLDTTPLGAPRLGLFANQDRLFRSGH